MINSPRLLRLLFLSVVTFLLVITVTTKLAGSWFTPASPLEISPTTQDLGQVRFGDVAQTSFAILNTTSRLVNLTRLSTSCGCTQAQADKTELKPGETALIVVSFDSAAHAQESEKGEVERTIYLDTDHPNFPVLTATINADVIEN
jgi:hypothetical protein